MRNCEAIGMVATGAAVLLWSAMSFAQGYPQTQPGTMGGAPGTMGAAGRSGLSGDGKVSGAGWNHGQPYGNAGGQMQDHTFMMKAAEGGLAEVQLGQLAQQNGQSQAVKDFGKRMVDDHSKANDQLKQVASQAGVTLPASPSSARPGGVQQLSKMQGDCFRQGLREDDGVRPQEGHLRVRTRSQLQRQRRCEGLRQPDPAYSTRPSEDGRADEEMRSSGKVRKSRKGTGNSSQQ